MAQKGFTQSKEAKLRQLVYKYKKKRQRSTAVTEGWWIWWVVRRGPGKWWVIFRYNKHRSG